MNCYKCQSPLSSDEVGLHKRLMGREATEHLCIKCMADFFECSEELLYRKIEAFRRTGCVLFEYK